MDSKIKENTAHSVLMVCTKFPPQADVGGLRPAMFAKYLPKYGWKPIIFTRILPDDDLKKQLTMEIEGLPSIEDHISFFYGTEDEQYAYNNRNIKTILKCFICPDLTQPPGLAEKMIAEGKKLIIKNKINIVWGTSPDFGCLSAAAHIAKYLNVPWVADFRDIHEQDKADTFRDRLLHWRIFFRRRQILKSAAEVVTVSEHHAKILEKSFDKKVHVIQNGFDSSLFHPVTSHKSDKFSIVYMGRILSEWLRNPRTLFEAMDILINILHNKLLYS